MGCIYLITNKDNNKKYVGQTTKHYLSRFGRHIMSAYSKPDNDLHREMALQGYNNFTTMILEDGIDDILLNEREQYFIDLLNPEYNAYILVDKVSKERVTEIVKLYKKGLTIKEISIKTRLGYISTMRVLHSKGYRTRGMLNKKEVKIMYESGDSVYQIAKLLGVSSTTITNAINEAGIPPRGNKKAVIMLTLDRDYLKRFESGREAGRYMYSNGYGTNIDSVSKHINECCRGTKRTGYGYIWNYDDIS